MVHIPAAFDGTLHIESGGSTLDIIPNYDDCPVTGVFVHNGDEFGGIELSPEQAMYVGQALTRCAYRALDQERKTG